MKISVADSGADIYGDLAAYGYYGIDLSFASIRSRELILSADYDAEIAEKYKKKLFNLRNIR